MADSNAKSESHSNLTSSGVSTSSRSSAPSHSDVTVVSSTPPVEPGAATAMLDPRQLGAALEGQQLDHVLLEKFIGGGGMGAVFRAWDTNLHRTVAVKIPSPRPGGGGDNPRRVLKKRSSAV